MPPFNRTNSTGIFRSYTANYYHVNAMRQNYHEVIEKMSTRVSELLDKELSENNAIKCISTSYLYKTESY